MSDPFLSFIFLHSAGWICLVCLFFYDIMVSVFNPAEFSFFLIGIMAQRGPAYLEKLQKIKEDRAAE